MVLRGLLTVWFFVASVLGPAFCCCASAAPRTGDPVSAAAPCHPVAPVAPAPTGGCPHCKPAPTKSSTPTKHDPAPSKPCPGDCPCKGHLVAAAVTDGAEFRIVSLFGWDPVLPEYTPLHAAPSVPEIGRTALHPTGPPPLSCPERLHLLHVLIC